VTTMVGVRVGITTGPLTGGVLGGQRLLYDVWGDTVNTAARLSATAALGEIYISEQASNALFSAEFQTPMSHMGPRDIMVSRPRVGYLKGKGMYPFRLVTATDTAYIPYASDMITNLFPSNPDCEHTFLQRIVDRSPMARFSDVLYKVYNKNRDPELLLHTIIMRKAQLSLAQ
ncbi:hypothetical protein KIPB_012940, partial [Kipferlia bialata]